MGPVVCIFKEFMMSKLLSYDEAHIVVVIAARARQTSARKFKSSIKRRSPINFKKVYK